MDIKTAENFLFDFLGKVDAAEWKVEGEAVSHTTLASNYGFMPVWAATAARTARIAGAIDDPREFGLQLAKTEEGESHLGYSCCAPAKKDEKTLSDFQTLLYLIDAVYDSINLSKKLSDDPIATHLDHTLALFTDDERADTSYNYLLDVAAPLNQQAEQAPLQVEKSAAATPSL